VFQVFLPVILSEHKESGSHPNECRILQDSAPITILGI